MLTPGTAFADRTFDAVLFDMDGTLISSIEAVERSWATWLREYGYDPDTVTLAHGTPARTLVESFVDAKLVEEAFARINAIELADREGVRQLAGAAQLLNSIPLDRKAIVTSCTYDLAHARIDASGLARPEVTVTADDVVVGKPDPEPFLLAARLLGVDPHRCLVVEDAPAGLAAGRAAGCATLAVSGTHVLAKLDADAHAPTVANLGVVVLADGSLQITDR